MNIQAVLKEHYGLDVRKIVALPGEEDRNYRVHTDTDCYVVKCTPPTVPESAVEFQVGIMRHLAKANLPIAIPKLVLAHQDVPYLKLEDGSWLRVHTWVAGRMLDQVRPQTPDLWQQWGKVAAMLNRALQGFDHPWAHRSYRWDPARTLACQPALKYFDTVQSELAQWFWDRFAREVVPRLAHLRHSLNYNDAHMHNLIVRGDVCAPRVEGVVDFGDCLYTHTVSELAIAMAYACMEQPDPLSTACEVLRGFHQVCPLQEDELAVLYDLVAARLLITVSMAAMRRHSQSTNDYWFVSERPAWDLLRRWRQLHPNWAYYAFRQVVGLDAVPQRAAFDRFVAQYKQSFHPVVRLPGPATHLDLSVGSTHLGHPSHYLDAEAFAKKIAQMLESSQARWGFGGYGEVRPFYTTDAYMCPGNEGRRWRTVHLGIDIWAPAGTPIWVPWDAQVHSWADNAQRLDYGPCIILTHQIPDGLKFWTLYGHLSRASLKDLYPGKTFQRGERLGTIGTMEENGSWPAHLHFQLILDVLGHEGDFPGVAFPDQWPLWQALCPDPTPFFSFSECSRPAMPARLDHTQLLALRQRYLGPNLSLSYDRPLHIVRGYMQHLYSADGRRYLDTVNNVPHVGHQHDAVVRAGCRQMEVLNTNTRYLHEEIVHFAEELLATLPSPLEVVYFVNSGSEANELALRIARTATHATDVMVLQTGYHGNTQGCIEVSSYKFDGPGGSGAPPHVHVVPTPDVYRGQYRNPDAAAQQYVAEVQKILNGLAMQGKQLAAFIFESIMSCAGQIVLPSGFLAAACRAVHQAGGVCIADEVQTGLGRVGDAFWAFQLHGIVPDIVTIGKPLGNGHPVGAVVTTRALADAFANGMEYFNTFGGNPVSCAIGRAVLGVVRAEKLQSHARRVGNALLSGLQQLQRRFPLIGDVRGHGLFLGFELVCDPIVRTPAPRQAHYLVNRMRQLGFLMSTDGKDHNVIKIKPPLCFAPRDAQQLLEVLAQVFQEDCMRID